MHYVKNKDLVIQVAISKEKGRMTPELVDMFMKIARETNKKLRYKDAMDKEDCISGAMEDLIRYWDRYNPEVSPNAFSFYSQMAKNGFTKVWNKLHPADLPTTSLSNESVSHNF